jgi:hypothetical protein
MIITGKQFRYFYPQKSLNFNFQVSNYSSNNFEIGITGTNYIYFKFKDGIIKDHYQNIVGTFNKDSVNIEAYIKNDKYEYYLNSLPVARDLIIANATSIFSALVVQIFDTPITNSIEISASVNGEKIPELEFSNFYSTEVTSVNLSNYNEYPVDIFSFSSSTITGEWLYPSILYPNQSSSFLNYDSTGIDTNTPVTLNLETNFGQKSYTLYVKELGSTLDPTEEEDFEITDIKYLFSSMSLHSGEILPTGQSKAIYKIDYALSDQNQKLDLSFDYIQGKTGDATITSTEEVDVTFSGFLTAADGKCSGLLYNSNLAVSKKDYSFYGLKSDITLYSDITLTGYFENLEATGNVTTNIDNTVTLSKNLNDQNLIESSLYYMDLGGKTGLYNDTKPNISNNYERIIFYKDLKINDTLETITITGEVKAGDGGKYTFKEVSVPIYSGVLAYSQDFSNQFITNNINKNLYPYRGVGIATLKNENGSSKLLSGDSNGSFNPFLLLDESSDTIFFKNIPNIDYNGQYVLTPLVNTNNLVKGRVLLDNKDTKYSKTGLYFNIDTEAPAKTFINDYIIKETIDSYRNLSPFEKIDNAKSQLFITRNQVKRPLNGQQLNWDENNFLTLKKDSISYFSANTNNPTFGLVFNDPLLLQAGQVIEPADGKNLIKSNLVTNFIANGTITETLNNTSIVLTKYETSLDTEDYILSYTFKTKQDVEAYNFSFYLKPSDDAQEKYFLQIFDEKGSYFIYSITTNGSNEGTVSSIDGNGYSTEQDSDKNNNASYSNFIRRFWVPIQVKPILGESIIKIRLVNGRGDATPSDGASYPFVPPSITVEPFSKYPAYFYIGGVQVEELTSLTNDPSRYEVYTESTSTAINTDYFPDGSRFDFFANKIRGINGRLYHYDKGSPNYEHVAFDSTEPDSVYKLKNSDCNNNECFVRNGRSVQTGPGIISRANLLKTYKGQSSTGGIWKFFNKYFLIYFKNITNNHYPRLYTNSIFTELYFKHWNPTETTITYKESTFVEDEEKNAFNEILSILKTYKPFDYTYKILNNKEYKIPLSLDNLDVIPDDSISDIVFSGYLGKTIQMNIQAGFARYYPYDDIKKSELFGYFYETPDFFDIVNETIISSTAGETVTSLSSQDVFPNLKDSINNRPFKAFYSNEGSPKIIRLLKNDSSVSFSTTLNRTVYISRCFFSKNRKILVDLTGTFYNAEKRMSSVWDIKIFNDLDFTKNPIYSSPTISDFKSSVYYAQGIASVKDGSERSLYLEVKYDYKDDFNVAEADKVLLSLISKQSDTAQSIVTDLTIL